MSILPLKRSSPFPQCHFLWCTWSLFCTVRDHPFQNTISKLTIKSVALNSNTIPDLLQNHCNQLHVWDVYVPYNSLEVQSTGPETTWKIWLWLAVYNHFLWQSQKGIFQQFFLQIQNTAILTWHPSSHLDVPGKEKTLLKRQAKEIKKAQTHIHVINICIKDGV